MCIWWINKNVRTGNRSRTAETSCTQRIVELACRRLETADLCSSEYVVSSSNRNTSSVVMPVNNICDLRPPSPLPRTVKIPASDYDLIAQFSGDPNYQVVEMLSSARTQKPDRHVAEMLSSTRTRKPDL